MRHRLQNSELLQLAAPLLLAVNTLQRSDNARGELDLPCAGETAPSYVWLHYLSGGDVTVDDPKQRDPQDLTKYDPDNKTRPSFDFPVRILQTPCSNKTLARSSRCSRGGFIRVKVNYDQKISGTGTHFRDGSSDWSSRHRLGNVSQKGRGKQMLGGANFNVLNYLIEWLGRLRPNSSGATAPGDHFVSSQGTKFTKHEPTSEQEEYLTSEGGERPFFVRCRPLVLDISGPDKGRMLYLVVKKAGLDHLVALPIKSSSIPPVLEETSTTTPLNETQPLNVTELEDGFNFDDENFNHLPGVVPSSFDRQSIEDWAQNRYGQNLVKLTTATKLVDSFSTN